MRVTEHRRRFVGPAAANNALRSWIAVSIDREYGCRMAPEVCHPQLVICEVKSSPRRVLNHALGSLEYADWSDVTVVGRTVDSDGIRRVVGDKEFAAIRVNDNCRWPIQPGFGA